MTHTKLVLAGRIHEKLYGAAYRNRSAIILHNFLLSGKYCLLCATRNDCSRPGVVMIQSWIIPIVSSTGNCTSPLIEAPF
jgi:hypothetical protein